MVYKEFEQRRVQRRFEVQLLPGDGRAHDGEDAGADHRTDAQGREREWAQGFLEPRLRIFRIRDQLVDGLLRE